jgi:pimeloyl-ACP methyl ester carboxylesterase
MPAMRQILFIQGGGGPDVHDAWDEKLVDSLKRALGIGWDVRYPRMPDEDDPKYAKWKPAIEREIARLDYGAVLVGHSIGGTMLVHALAEIGPRRLSGGQPSSAMPERRITAIGEGGWPSDEIEAKADLGARLPGGVPVHLFHGSEDDTAPPSHVGLYVKAIPQAEIHRLPDRDHQLNNDLREVADVVRELSAFSKPSP